MGIGRNWLQSYSSASNFKFIRLLGPTDILSEVRSSSSRSSSSNSPSITHSLVLPGSPLLVGWGSTSSRHCKVPGCFFPPPSVFEIRDLGLKKFSPLFAASVHKPSRLSGVQRGRDSLTSHSGVCCWNWNSSALQSLSLVRRLDFDSVSFASLCYFIFLRSSLQHCSQQWRRDEWNLPYSNKCGRPIGNSSVPIDDIVLVDIDYYLRPIICNHSQTWSSRLSFYCFLLIYLLSRVLKVSCANLLTEVVTNQICWISVIDQFIYWSLFQVMAMYQVCAETKRAVEPVKRHIPRVTGVQIK